MDGMSYFGLWPHGYGSYEYLSIVDTMNNSRSCELKPLDAMSNSELWMI